MTFEEELMREAILPVFAVLSIQRGDDTPPLDVNERTDRAARAALKAYYQPEGVE